MLLGVAGPGGQFPRPVPVPHIIQGVLGIRFTHIHYTCNMQVFQLFSPVFAVFRAFLHHFPHFWPPGPTCRAELGAGTQKQGAGNHKPPGWGREKLRTGRGARPRTAQRRDGGRPSAPIPGAERRPAPEGGTRCAGGRQAREGSRQETGQHSGAGGQRTRRAPAEGGRPAREKGRRSRRPAAYRRCPARLCRTGQAGGGCGPPQSAEPAGPNAATPPRDGGGPPPPGPTLQVCTGAANNALAPGPRWQMAGQRWG